MRTHPQHGQERSEVKELRQEAGQWLQKLRLDAGLSQRALANAVGVDYYTFVSQIESGRGRVPPERYELWAKAVNIDVSEFTQHLLQYYDPITYRLLFGVK